MSMLVDFAHSELTKVGLFEATSEYNGELGRMTLALVTLFASQRHSGGSAMMVASLLSKLLAYEPLSPLTGADDEWNDVSDMSGYPLWQNNRYGRVFKNLDGTAYDIEGKIFEQADGTLKSTQQSATPVTFPYTPRTDIVKYVKPMSSLILGSAGKLQ